MTVFRRALATIGALVLLTTATVAVAIPAAGAGTAPPATATLRLTEADVGHVEVQRASADEFKPGRNDQRLRVGDAVRTDDVGHAEVQYDDESFTRLDTNTTFTIEQLTDDQGNRQVVTTIDSGRTWNRAEALTESESFEQTGADATAAVEGTAFAVECDTEDHCLFIAVYHATSLRGNGDENRQLNPLDTCDSSDGTLCGAVDALSIEEIAALEWIQQNLARDLEERGLGPGPFVVVAGTRIVQTPSGVIVVQVGGTQVTAPEDPADEEEPPPPPPPPPPDEPAAPCNGHGRGRYVSSHPFNGLPNTHDCD
jgi:hypothetical protein